MQSILTHECWHDESALRTDYSICLTNTLFHYNYIIPPPHHAIIWENCHAAHFLTFSILNYLFLADLQQYSFYPFFSEQIYEL